jgi:hypothetical protein
MNNQASSTCAYGTPHSPHQNKSLALEHVGGGKAAAASAVSCRYSTRYSIGGHSHARAPSPACLPSLSLSAFHVAACVVYLQVHTYQDDDDAQGKLSHLVSRAEMVSECPPCGMCVAVHVPLCRPTLPYTGKRRPADESRRPVVVIWR